MAEFPMDPQQSKSLIQDHSGCWISQRAMKKRAPAFFWGKYDIGDLFVELFVSIARFEKDTSLDFGLGIFQMKIEV